LALILERARCPIQRDKKRKDEKAEEYNRTPNSENSD